MRGVRGCRDRRLHAAAYAVVTGASSGIGLELARQFSIHGHDVLMVAEDDDVIGAAAALGGAGSGAARQVDLRDFDAVERLWEEISAAGRPVDAIALNAGVGSEGVFVRSSLLDDIDLIELNVASIVHLAKRALQAMVARGAGRVLLTAVTARTPGPCHATATAATSFVQSFAMAVRAEVAPYGVTVTALLPSPMETTSSARVGSPGRPDDPVGLARAGFEALMAGTGQVVAGANEDPAGRAGFGAAGQGGGRGPRHVGEPERHRSLTRRPRGGGSAAIR